MARRREKPLRRLNANILSRADAWTATAPPGRASGLHRRRSDVPICGSGTFAWGIREGDFGLCKRLPDRRTAHNWTWTFEPEDGGTRLNVGVIEQNPPRWQRAMDRLTEKSFNTQVRDRLARMKAMVEEQSTTLR